MTICIGVDLHKTQFTVYARKGDGFFAKYVTDEKGYRGFLDQLAKWCTAGDCIRIGVESTGNTRYFKNRMEREGHEVKVINTLKFKIVTESVKKTDRHDATTIAEFLEKDMLPEARLCSEESEQVRRLLKVRRTLVRAVVTVKNQIHGLLCGMGMQDAKASLQSKRGRRKIQDALLRASGLVVQPLFETIDRLEENVKLMEREIEALTKDDPTVELLRTIPGCGPITAWTIRAYTDDIRRFNSYKKYSSFAGLAPWVQCSNTTEHYGRITKRGPEELRTALVQLVLGMRRSRKAATWRIMERYVAMKQDKGPGKSIIATARKLSKIIWYMLTKGESFRPELMVDKKLHEKAEAMRAILRQSA